MNDVNDVFDYSNLAKSLWSVICDIIFVYSTNAVNLFAITFGFLL